MLCSSTLQCVLKFLNYYVILFQKQNITHRKMLLYVFVCVFYNKHLSFFCEVCGYIWSHATKKRWFLTTLAVAHLAVVLYFIIVCITFKE